MVWLISDLLCGCVSYGLRACRRPLLSKAVCFDRVGHEDHSCPERWPSHRWLLCPASRLWRAWHSRRRPLPFMCLVWCWLSGADCPNAILVLVWSRSCGWTSRSGPSLTSPEWAGISTFSKGLWSFKSSKVHFEKKFHIFIQFWLALLVMVTVDRWD